VYLNILALFIFSSVLYYYIVLLVMIIAAAVQERRVLHNNIHVGCVTAGILTQSVESRSSCRLLI